MKNFLAILLTAAALCGACRNPAEDAFVRVENGRFTGDGPGYFIGTNFWYGAILASDGVGGDMERLTAELDSLKSLGLTNLRVLVGGDGPDGIPTRVTPTLHKAPGEYDETLFVGLDRLLAEMGARGMKAVLYLNNAWEWSGGYRVYLEWAGRDESLISTETGYSPYMRSVARFAMDEKAKELFADHVRTVVSRVNTVTGKPYRDDPAIFSWQICNEPRCFSQDPSVKEAFADWIWSTASLIKSLDPNHMVSTGNEGTMGCEGDPDLFEKIHACPDIDYVTIHIWPYNWRWVKENTLSRDLDEAIRRTDEYIDMHSEIAARHGKPMVIEEFGFPRDGFRFSSRVPTTARDRYYAHVFDRVIASSYSGGVLAGANFWGWGGFAGQAQDHVYWEPGDDYCGDPAQEQQGLNSVYARDRSTLRTIRMATARLRDGITAEEILENDWMYHTGEVQELRVRATGRRGASGILKLHLSEDDGTFVTEMTEKVRIQGEGEQTVAFRMHLGPGFYRVRLSVGDGEPFAEFNIGCDPEAIISPQDKQPDFDEFWDSTLAELASVDPQAKLTLLPEHSDGVRRTYRVDMRSLGGEAISGVLTEPVREGKYPVFINYMGYNSNVWYSDPSSKPDVIEFTLCVRDQALNKPSDSTADWVTWGLESKETYYYRGAFADVVRAVDFVASLPKADTGRIFAEGGSQGGAFTLIAASLDHRIRAAAPYVPFLSDYPDYFRIADWPGGQVLAAAKERGISEEDLYRTLSYFDVKNFTDRIGCPVLMGFGLQDPTCPPHTNFAGFNQIRTEKEWVCFPRAGHQVEREDGWWKARDAFMGKYL